VLLQNLRRDFPLEVAPVLLAPLIYPDNPDRPMDKINQDMSSISNTMVIIFDFLVNILVLFCNFFFIKKC
jgi:hypothetical protein